MSNPCSRPTRTPSRCCCPDDLVVPSGAVVTMAKVRAKRRGSVLCAIEVEPDEVSACGVFDVETVPDAVNPDAPRSTAWWEKPDADKAPSLCGRRPLPALDRARSSDALRRFPRGVGGEIQLTDAIAC